VYRPRQPLEHLEYQQIALISRGTAFAMTLIDAATDAATNSETKGRR
jgi:hypothetical protein